LSEKISNRIKRLEAKFHSDLPVYRVKFADGTIRDMRYYELFFYGVKRSGPESDLSQGVLEAATVPYTDYELISGDAGRYLSPFLRESIEAYKNI